jgi:5-methylcytosine-specific restriction enzyme A
MSRSVPIWIGKDDDAVPPARVRARVFMACEGKCHRCGRKIGASDKWTLEHLNALILGGKNREDNLGCTCEWCLPIKNAEDQAAKSKVADMRNKHLGIRKPSRMAGSRNSKWKKKLNGEVVARD